MRWPIPVPLAAFLLCAPAGFAVEVPVSVREPAGIARTNQPATGGIPFKPGQVTDVDELALIDADGNPLPAQFTTLNEHPDGSVRWVLVDFLCTVPANGTAKYTLRTGATNPPPKTPLKIGETRGTGTVVVDTGAVAFSLSTKAPTLQPFSSIEAGAKKLVKDSRLELLNCELEEKTVGKGRRKRTQSTLKEDGEVYTCGAAAPRRVRWEYRGPVRATLRLDGEYEGEGPPLSYTTRITAWAGCPSIRVEHAIRNSNPAEGNDAFIKRAALTLDLGIDAEPEGRGLDWAAGGDGTVGLLVQNRHTGGIYRGPGTYLRSKFGCGWSRGWNGLYGQDVKGGKAFVEVVSEGPTIKNEKGALGFTQDGVFALADRSHKASEIWLDFYADKRDAKANEGRARAFRSRLWLVAPGAWYSETEGLGIGQFGTLADEKATYEKWGWKDTGEYNPPSLGHDPFAYVPRESIHDVSEDDCAEGYLLQFLRTGDRGFLDWAIAWGDYYRCHAIYRTDWGGRWGVEAPKGERPAKGLRFHWYGPHMYDWADTRMHRCHHYGRGIFDLYHLTGRVDLLEAGLDLADQMGYLVTRSKPGGGFKFGRSWGRAFLTVLSAWQATRDPRWEKAARHGAACVLQAKNWDPDLQIYMQSLGIKNSYFARAWTKGHFDLKSNPRWKKMLETRSIPKRLDEYLTKTGTTCRYDRGRIIATRGDREWEVTYLTQVFELSACHMGLARYARLFDDKAMVERLCEITEGVDRHYWSDKCHFMIGSPWFGWPDEGKVLDPADWLPSHDKCPADGGGKHSGYATRYTADVFARCYSFTNDPKWLRLAKRSWNRGSKRLYQRRRQCAATDEIGPWAYIRGAHNNTLTECSARLFYEVPRTDEE
ncbi:MAG: hypothetical protein ACOC8E_01400 [Planctomycetota bacterium]